MAGSETSADVISDSLSLLGLAQTLGGHYDRFWAHVVALDASSREPVSSWHLDHIDWLRRALAQDERLDREQRVEAIHRLKWGVDIMLDTADGDLALAEAMLGQVESAARREGLGQRAVLFLRARLSAEHGDLAATSALLEQAQSAPVDDLGDCRPCEIRETALLVERTDPRQALTLLDPLLRPAHPCRREPGLSLGHAARLAAALGENGIARQAYRYGWPVVARDSSLGSAVAGHVIASAARGRMRAAYDLLARRTSWLGQLPTDVENFYLFAAAHAVQQHSRNDRRYPQLERRADEIAQKAQGLARAFDARSGGGYRTGQLSTILATVDKGASGRLRGMLRF